MDKSEPKFNIFGHQKQKAGLEKERVEETKFYNKFMANEYVYSDGSEQSVNEEQKL